MDYIEKDSENSGSFCSDNTDALLNASLKDFEDNESVLESISQVGRDVDFYHSPERKIPTQVEKQQWHVKNEVHFSMPFTSSGPNYPPQALLTSNEGSKLFYPNEGNTDAYEVQSRNSIQQPSNTFALDRKHEEGFYSKVGSLKNDISHIQQQFSPDSDTTTSGRQSVIKLHTSLPSSMPDSAANSSNFDQNRKVYINSEEGNQESLGNVKKAEIHQTQQTTVNGPFAWWQTGSMQDSSQRMEDINDHQDMGTQRNLRDSHGTPGAGESRHDNEGHSGTNLRDFHGMIGAIRGNNVTESAPEESQDEEMLLGLRHDRETDEIYDDKVREGADLLSKLLGKDHNSSFTSFSSRSSETRPSSLREKTSVNKQRSLDSSLHSEPRLPRSSSPNKAIDQRGQLKSSLSGDHLPLRHHRSLDSLNTDTRFHENFSTKTAVDPASRGHPKSYVDAKRSASDDGCATQNVQSAGSDVPADHRLEKLNSYFEQKAVKPKELNSHERGNLVSQSERTRNDGFNDCSALDDIDLKRLELDVEEILSRKKMATHELQMLDESLQRNRADMKSSESLVEQYRWQATQARSDLMDLEKKRNDLLEECSSLEETLKRSKQKEAFDSDNVIFGRSKDEVFRALQEREKFKHDLDSMQETLKREQKKAKVAQDDLREKIGSLEAELCKQKDESVKNLEVMKEHVNKERQRVRIVQQDKLNAVNKIYDEIREQNSKESETLKTQLLRERKSHVEIVEEKLKREISQWKRATENAEIRIKQLEESLFERNEELDRARKILREEKQKNLDLEKKWRSQLENERQDYVIKFDEQERSWKGREEKHASQLKNLENLVEERTTDFRRSEERCKSQTEELQKIIENKNEDMKMIRGLVRQQEDATRVLGERLRNEAREHVRNAVEKERRSLNQEKERIKRMIDEEKQNHDNIVKQMTEELDIEKDQHSQTKDTLNKLKQEGDELRKQLVEVHGDRVNRVQRARHENGEELGKMNEKLLQLKVQTEKLERIDEENAKEIHEECRKIAEMIDTPLAYKTPPRFSSEDKTQESVTKEALARLRLCNEELRQHLSEMKKQISAKQSSDETSRTSSELAELKKRLSGKEEEMKRLQRKHSEEMSKLRDEKRKEQLSYKKTITKLEQEFQKLVAAKSPGTPYKTKQDISRSTITSSNGVAHIHSPSVNEALSRSVEKSSSADLLKHLQDRVKKLRAENENLKKSSDKESFARNSRNPESALLQSKGLTISQLRTSKGSDSISENIEQVSRIQKLLVSSVKGDLSVGLNKKD
ncbi:protein FAM184A-like isoform X2 [Dendronephthya gigantea]|nr:protein FAM184A-like isoform X2 [Dendronephthya gigantea]XP_028400722.1 protein FAM184A-like isoform X2 [Dendronephthya gigantea]